jgi:RHS repeat-associated protein
MSNVNCDPRRRNATFGSSEVGGVTSKTVEDCFTEERESTNPVYTSDGLLAGLVKRPAPGGVETRFHIFRFAGRPVAQLETDGTTSTWVYLTTDHLGTPILATNSAGAALWSGGFEPFGADWKSGTSGGASENGIFLRLPGQWDDASWQDAALGADVYHNVHRWYQPTIGRYSRPDPLGLRGSFHVYAYGKSNPLFYFDRRGYVESDADCSCCTDPETTRQFLQIRNYAVAHAADYRVTGYVFSGGCGAAADRLQRDVEKIVKPTCWITESQLVTAQTGLNVVSYWLFGVPAGVHRELKITPCSPNVIFNESLAINPYYGIGPIGPVLIGPIHGEIEDLTDPPPWCEE